MKNNKIRLGLFQYWADRFHNSVIISVFTGVKEAFH